MYTSYFAKYKGPNGYAITANTPVWAVRHKRYGLLAPTSELVWRYKNGDIAEAQYEEQYFKILLDRGITPQQVLQDIGNEAVLLCFEKTGSFCHRHLAAAWLRKGGIEISEIE